MAPPSPRTGQRRGYEFEYENLEEAAQDSCKRHRFPPRTSDKERIYCALGFGGGLVITYTVYLAIGTAFIAKSLGSQDGPALDPETPEFALYKNSRFKECYGKGFDRTECVPILKQLFDNAVLYYREPGLPGFSKMVSPTIQSPPTVVEDYEWCDVVRCLTGFRVIPSQVQPAALRHSPLSLFIFFTLLSLSAAWHAFSSFWEMRKGQDRRKCRGLRDVTVIGWIFFVWDLCGPFGWWWISFFRFLVDRSLGISLSPLAWFAIWRNAAANRHHPISCAFPGGLKANRIIGRCLTVLTVVQWFASWYYMAASDFFKSGISNPQVYSCLPSQLDSSPGSSSCSADQLCSRTPLFRDHEFRTSVFAVLNMFTLFIFFIWSIPLLIDLAVTSWSALAGSNRHSQKRLRRAKITSSAVQGGALFFGALYAVVFGGGFSSALWRLMGPEEVRNAAFVVDWECTAVHVCVSPWRYYLDLSIYQRIVRAVRLWFTG